jgi:hypothetical protein
MPRPDNEDYFYQMLKYGITGFVMIAAAISCYFLLAYKLDTIIVYDREAAYTAITPYLSIEPAFMISKDKELKVFLTFTDVKETVCLKNLAVNVSPVNAVTLLSVRVSNPEINEEASSFAALPEGCRKLYPQYSKHNQQLTFTFKTTRSHTTKYLVTIKGELSSGTPTHLSSFSKQINIREQAVFRDRNWLF